MKTSPQAQTSQTPTLWGGSTGSANSCHELDQLPMGATQLDSKGRTLHRLVAGGFAQEPRCIQMAGKNFFEEYLEGTALEYLEQVYLDGVRKGELYHFVDVQVRKGNDDHELTLFLYYHAASGQGWLFIEPHSEASERLDITQRRAA